MTLWNIPSNITSMSDLFFKVNGMIGGDIVAYMLIYTIFSIVFIASLTQTTMEKSLLLAGWITTITSIFVVVIFQISPQAIVIPTIIMLVAIFLVRK